MNSVFLNYIRAAVNPNYGTASLKEALETWDKYHDKTNTEIVRDFFNQKIYGVKTLRLVRDIGLGEAKTLYETIHDQIENEVDVNLLGLMLKEYCKSNYANTAFKVDMKMFDECFDQVTTDPVARTLYSDYELTGLGYDPFVTKLYRAARNHYNERLV